LKTEELPKGLRLAVDANVLIYHFSGLSQQCRQLLSRCQSGEIAGFCPAHIALEVLHRLMMLEAATGGLAGSNPAKKLGQAPDKVKTLRSSYANFELLEAFGLKTFGLSPKAVQRTPWWSLQYGLLANDAALLASMEEQGLRDLVTADRQFLGIAQIRTWLIDDVVQRL
jgi:predicted nucleic acid-binding protein